MNRIGSVLLVDDDEENLDALAKELTRKGFRVEAFSDAESVYERIQDTKASRPGVGVVSLTFKGVGNGLVIADRLQEGFPHIALIFLSDETDAVSPLPGCRIYIKPILDLVEFSHTIESQLKSASMCLGFSEIGREIRTVAQAVNKQLEFSTNCRANMQQTIQGITLGSLAVREWQQASPVWKRSMLSLWGVLGFCITGILGLLGYYAVDTRGVSRDLIRLQANVESRIEPEIKAIRVDLGQVQKTLSDQCRENKTAGAKPQSFSHFLQ